MLRHVRPLMAASLSLLFSPICIVGKGLCTSWIAEAGIGCVFAVSAYLIVAKVKRTYLAWMLVFALPVLSAYTSRYYMDWVYSDSFPYALLDSDSKGFRDLKQNLKHRPRPDK